MSRCPDRCDKHDRKKAAKHCAILQRELFRNAAQPLRISFDLGHSSVGIPFVGIP